jgi:hypothetical protein
MTKKKTTLTKYVNSLDFCSILVFYIKKKNIFEWHRRCISRDIMFNLGGDEKDKRF